jgi:predicted porin
MMKSVYTFFILVLVSQLSFAAGSASANQTPLVNVDIGGSTGTYNGSSYSELNLGVNLNFTDWLTWRNAAFKRFTSVTGQDYSGLDSTMRLISNTPFTGGAFHLFVGAGYRFTDKSDKNATVGEAGLGVNAGRFGIGASAKYLRYDKVQFDSNGVETKRDDLIYTLTLSGGTSFSF